MTATDLVCWTKMICFADVVEPARCEIDTFRYRVLHVAARLTRGARRFHLRIDKTWRWAVQIAEGFHQLRTASADAEPLPTTTQDPENRSPAAPAGTMPCPAPSTRTCRHRPETRHPTAS